MRTRWWWGPHVLVTALLLAYVMGAELAHAQAAVDGQTLASQSSRTQQTFMGMYGPGCAAQEWAWQHDLVVAHRVLPTPVTGIPCPAARSVNPDAIDTGHLVDAVGAAGNGNLPEAHANLNQ